MAQQHPKAAIVISLHSGGRFLEECISAIDYHTTYPNCQIIVINDLSKDSVELTSCVKAARSIPTQTLKVEDTCSHSEKMNLAVESVDAEILVFVDEDIHITTSNWLDQLVGTIQADATIGAVGPLLTSQKGKTFHAGIILGVKSGVGLACRNTSSQLPGDCGRTHSIQEYSALTSAMLLVSRTAFNAVGGFNAQKYPDAFNDIDLCLRIKTQGLRCIYNPMVKAVSKGKNSQSESPENKHYLTQLRQDYPGPFSNDPFYNPNLSLDNEWFLGYREFPTECQIPELLVI